MAKTKSFPNQVIILITDKLNDDVKTAIKSVQKSQEDSGDPVWSNQDFYRKALSEFVKDYNKKLNIKA